MNQLNLVPSIEMTELLVALGQDKHFVRLIELLEQRANGLAVWAHMLKDETQLRWAGGRVQELSDLLTAYYGRHTLAKAHHTVMPEGGNDF